MIKPLNNKILVEIILEEEKTKSGIILPDKMGENKKDIGIVLAEGNNSIHKQELIGKKVFFDKWSTEQVELEDKKYFIVEDTKILAVLE